MTLSYIVSALLFLFTFPLAVYVSYVGLLWFLSRSKNKKSASHSMVSRSIEPTQGSASLPKVSLVFPTYNEEEIIVKKMENVYGLDYPADRLEIIVVDDASDDGTVGILEGMRRDNLRIIKHHSRKGYSQAMITGVRHASGEIVTVTDAGALHDQKALRKLVSHFEDPRVGAVTGRQVLLGKEHGIGPKLEERYSRFYNSMRKRECMVDSTFDTKGEISAYRREIVENVSDPRLNFMGTWDIYLGFFTRLRGFGVKYEEDAVFYEYAPYSIKDWLRQKINRATIVLDTMSAFRGMVLNRKFGLFGLLILPFRYIILFVNPMLLCLGFALAIYAGLINPGFGANVWIGLLVLVALMSISVFRHFVMAFCLSQLALVVALLRVTLGKKKPRVLWSQIPSTRGSHV